tara:strand:+ start:1121 stop:1837 length:717 start_codon:yes stop_codon:yes gene_type:complete
MNYNSDAGQDAFVLNATKFKKHGFFLEFGAQHPINSNNTYILDNEYDWIGMMVEWHSKYQHLYEEYRGKDVMYVIEDALALSYDSIFKEAKFPKNIDYLQIDLEAGMMTPLDLLMKLENEVMDDYKFATVTFEHDIYCARPNSKDNVGGEQNGWVPYNPENFHQVRDKSREIFERHGYFSVFKDVKCSRKYQNPFEDWWVHPDLVDMNHIQKIIDLNKDNFEDNDVTQLAISGPDILY